MNTISQNLKLILVAAILTAIAVGIGSYYISLGNTAEAEDKTQAALDNLETILADLQKQAPEVSDTATVTLDLSDTSIAQGESGTLDIVLNTGNESIKAISLYITYDPETLVLAEDTTAKFDDFDLKVRRDNDRESGVIQIDLGTSRGEGVSGKVIVARYNIGRLEPGQTEIVAQTYQENSESDTLFSAFVNKGNKTFSFAEEEVVVK